MLDFSGRHSLDADVDGSFLNGQRSTDHREISKIAYAYDAAGNEIETGIETSMPDFIRRGAIRIDIYGTINLSVKPTTEQKAVLERLIRRCDGDVTLDFGDGWDSEHYAEYYSASPRRVLSDIGKYFDEGLKPEGNIKFFRAKDGHAYGFTLNGKIYIDPRIATSETPLHEYAHLWAEALRKSNPAAWGRLAEEMMSEKALYDHVKSLYPELKGNDLIEEVFAHYAGKRGVERMRAERARMLRKAKDETEKSGIMRMFGKLRNLLNNFWTEARKLFAGSTKDIENMSAADFADMALSDLLHQFNPDIRFSKAGSVKVSVAEYVQIAQQIASYPKKIERGHVFTANNYYLCTDIDKDGNFKIIATLPIEGNEDLINEFRRGVPLASVLPIRGSESVISIVDRVQGAGGRVSGDYASAKGQLRGTQGDASVSVGQQADSRGNRQEARGDSREQKIEKPRYQKLSHLTPTVSPQVSELQRAYDAIMSSPRFRVKEGLVEDTAVVRGSPLTQGRGLDAI